MKTLIYYLSFILLVLFSLNVDGQTPEFDVEGAIRSTDLSGTGNRVLISDEDGQLKIGGAGDTLKVGVIQLLDGDGDVRLELNAAAGHFQMLDNDTVFYELSVQSPPKIVKDHGNGRVTAHISNPLVVDVVRQQLLTNLSTAFPMEFDVLSDLMIAQSVEVELEIEKDDLGFLDIGSPTENEINGTLKYMDMNGELQILLFVNSGDQGTGEFKNTLLNNRTKERIFFIIDADTNAVPMFPDVNEENQASATPLGQNFSFEPVSDQTFNFNSGMMQDQNDEFNIGVYGQHVDGSTTNGFSLDPDGLNIQKGSNHTTFSDGKIEFTDGVDNQSIEFNPIDNTLESTSYLQTINPVDATHYNQLNPDGFMVANGTTGESFFMDKFGISLFDGSNFVGLGFDLANSTNINEGDLNVTGMLFKAGGSFKIDHPLDPDNKWLYHSFVESPDMMNVYNGNIVTDESGEASVTLPHYFETLNMDYRYQLTVIGVMAQAIILEKIENNQFKIKTNLPNVEVSWQVTGIRNDDYARENRIQTEVNKSEEEIGRRQYNKNRSAPYFYKTKEKHKPIR